MIDVVSNIPDHIVNNVERWIVSTKIPWFYFNHTLGDVPKGDSEVEQSKYIIKDLPRFTHYFYPNSKTPDEDKKIVAPLSEWCIKNILPHNYEVKRVMGNMTLCDGDSSKLLNIPHVDSHNNNFYSFLYYVNTSDGVTVFFKDRKIEHEIKPIKGTGVLFPSNVVHAGQIPSINKTRYVINIIFGKRD